jgi:RNA polymerase sigma factor (sigma-70 family)
MAGVSSRGVWKQLDELFCFGASGQLGDDELLGRFLAGHRDESAEAAFAALVDRHGPMVLGVCRRVLGDRHEAEDAFQATFLVLARKAGAIARREQLANWLHGVASRTALDARARADRRRAREQRAFAMSAAAAMPDDLAEHGELRAALDEELARLPASYRGAVVLCELDGLSRHAAARRLGIPEGTLSSRLARAKDLLRHRLTRRGLAPSAVALEAALSREARALILPPSLAGSTIQAAARVAAGASLAEAVSASVVTLTRGVLHTMLLAKIKGIALGLAAAAVVTTGVGVLAQGPIREVPAPGPSEDRLGAVEKKLDRILEALGTNRLGGGGGSGMRRESRPAASPDVAPEGGAAAGVVPGSPTTAPAVASPGMPQPGEMGSMTPMMRGQMGGRMEAMGATMRGKMMSPIEARVADLERRFADLERRLDAMESRSTSGSRTVPPAPPQGRGGAGGVRRSMPAGGAGAARRRSSQPGADTAPERPGHSSDDPFAGDSSFRSDRDPFSSSAAPAAPAGASASVAAPEGDVSASTSAEKAAATGSARPVIDPEGDVSASASAEKAPQAGPAASAPGPDVPR